MSQTHLKVAAVQCAWESNPVMHQEQLAESIYTAAAAGAEMVSLQELTLSPYFCTRPDARCTPESITEGPTALFVSAMAKKNKVSITASLFEEGGYNTAVAFDKNGQFIAKTRKQHIPSGEKYHEDFYFKQGDSQYPVHEIAHHKIGLPTCYDQWFPELSRIYGLKGVEVLVYPTAIGGEPTAPQIDTQPMWQQVMVAQGIMANTFIIAVNRIGCEDNLTFYGSSFISTPLGEILASAPRDKPAVLVAELDFSLRDLWGRLFPFARQRAPSTYETLLKPMS